MKLLKYVCVLITISFSLSCKNEVKSTIDSQKTTTTILQENLQNIEIDIEGMTCEIGCAKIIQSKVYKLNGVTHSKVSFTHKTGQFTFDSSKTSIEEITHKINGIAGGELYKATNHYIVSEFSDITKTLEK